jgi:hypothetical protein
VDVTADSYRMLASYMIKLTPADLADPAQVRALAQAGGLDERALVERFGGLVSATAGRASAT